ncbi:MAG: DUF3006 domain-containing protein [Tissierellaceae bacterium]|nr:DUF3006 domain-containing protein [Tissierellaceae bacterium]
MKIIIDRFEGDFAVVELDDKGLINMPIELVPEGAKEGDVIEIQINHEETRLIKEEKEKKWLNLWD